MNWIQAMILAIVEGITEFLPVSSTGHMIITSTLMGIQSDAFTKLFTVAIQFGAILSVVVLYYKRFFKSLDFYYKLVVAFIPTGVLGLLLKKYVDQLLDNVTVVAVSLVVGGIILLFVDNLFRRNEYNRDRELSYLDAFWIGVIQAISFIPGVSRSAATTIGGMVQGLNRKQAAEFAFFLAVPTMFVATLKDLWDNKELLASHADYVPLLVVGNIIAFVVAIGAIRFFIDFLVRFGFRWFGVYRIIVGSILLLLLWLGYDLQVM
jgi:undecaprenyl-diphosphatase